MKDFLASLVPKPHLALFILLSIVMHRLAYAFSMNGMLDHPQFALFDYCYFAKGVDYIFQLGSESKELSAYCWFFFIDFVWAPIGLFVIGKIIHKFLFPDPPITHTGALKLRKVLFTMFLIFATISYALDVVENLNYLNKNILLHHIEGIVITKNVGYGLCLFFLFLCLYRFWLAPYWTQIKTFLQTSYFSLLIIIIIGGLLIYLPQGGTIIVDLFYRPLNLLVVLLLLFFMSLTLSHYPSYIEAGKYTEEITWCMYNGLIPARWLGIGLITFRPSSSTAEPLHALVRNLRHGLGLLVLAAMIFAVSTIARRYEVVYTGGWILTLGVLGFFCWYYYQARRHLDLKGKLLLLRISAIVSILLTIATVAVAVPLEWSAIPVMFLIGTLISMIWFYVSFRLARKHLYWWENNLNYVRAVSMVGGISFAMLVLINLCIDFTVNHVHPLTILLLYLSNFYGLMVIIAKHIRFYHDGQHCNEDDFPNYLRTGKFRYLKYGIPLAIIVIAIYSVAVIKLPSDLHTLEQATETNPLKLKQFVENLPPSTEDHTPIDHRFHINSYGGGLKANLWNLLVFNELQEVTKGEFLNAVISVSSNSGGTMGVGNYAALWAADSAAVAQNGAASLEGKIFDIGNLNHLSIDVTYLFGRDLLREVWPFRDYCGQDRSWEAMRRYNRLTGLDSLILETDSTFRDSWRRIYQRSGHYPVLIVNTFSTMGRQGNALSLESDDPFNRMFPGSIDILNRETTITYYGALSTSNRFPILSPTAHIDGKGHFLDGGYFDNSGLSTSLSFQKYLLAWAKEQSDSSFTKALENTHQIVIDSDKLNYWNDVLLEYRDVDKKVGAIGEINAIVSSLLSLNTVPYHFEGMLENDQNFTAIRLPYMMGYEEVLSLYKATPKIPFDTLAKRISENNQMIAFALDKYRKYKPQWGVVEPPLARLNSEPAIRYQEAMIKYHTGIRNKLQRICDLMGLEVKVE